MEVPPAETLKAPMRLFKLRFAAAREPGRSHLTALRPLRLPALVTGKVGVNEKAAPRDLEQQAERQLSRVQAAHRQPQLTSQQYGLWSEAGGRWYECHWLHHHIVDSPWLKAQLRVVTADGGFRR